jgi:hypothetical protein
MEFGVADSRRETTERPTITDTTLECFIVFSSALCIASLACSSASGLVAAACRVSNVTIGGEVREVKSY